MIRILEKGAVLGAFLMLAGVGSARAATVEARVPFDFVVRGQTLPAGHYLIERDDNDPYVLYIRGKESRTNVFVITEPAGDHDPAGDQPALRFTRDGSQYRLEEIWPSRDQGWQIEPS